MNALCNAINCTFELSRYICKTYSECTHRTFPRMLWLKYQVKLIRMLLRKFPDWHEGHLKLGCVELENYELSLPEKKANMLAAVKLSALATLELCDIKKSSRESAAAHFLLATVSMHSGKKDVAFLAFEKMLNLGEAKKLSDTTLAKLLENCALCALELDKKEEALTLLSRIPKDLRNIETNFQIRALGGEINLS